MADMVNVGANDGVDLCADRLTHTWSPRRPSASQTSTVVTLRSLSLNVLTDKKVNAKVDQGDSRQANNLDTLGSKQASRSINKTSLSV